jgi:hypothetical protein
MPAHLAFGPCRNWVKCRRTEEAAVTVGVPQIADDFAAMPQSAGAGQISDVEE